MIAQKSMSSVVALLLLFIISITSVVNFQQWIDGYASIAETKVEKESNNDFLRLDRVIGNQLYLYSDSNGTITYFKIYDKKGKEMCSYSVSSIFDENDLIGYWSFDDYNSTHVFDVSGNGLDGGIYNDVRISKGILGDAVSFDGYNDYIMIYDAPLIDSSLWSVSTWAKFGNKNKQILFSFNETSLPRVELVHYMNNEESNALPLLYLNSNENDYYRYGIDVFANAGWHHLVYVFNDDKSIIKIYVDGIDNTGNGPDGNIAQFDSVWQISGSYHNSINGTVDELKVFKRDLTDNEVKNLYFFNQIKLDIHKGINIISIEGCNLHFGQIYNFLLFAEDIKIEKEIIAN